MFKVQTRAHIILLLCTVFLFESLAQPVMALQTTPGVQTAQPSKLSAAEQAANEKHNQAQFKSHVTTQMLEAMKSGFGGRDPAMRDLLSIDVKEIDSQIPDFSGAPVDADPFFMRSQHWVDGNQAVKDYAVVGDERSTEILLPGSDRKLVLDIPLRSLIATDEYLFFTLHPKSDLFERAAGVSKAEGDGLFVIETALLGAHAAKKTPVPVFFLPIMGNGWRSDLTAMQIVQGDILAVANKESVIPFLMKDIREMIQISKINLDTSMLISLTKRDSNGKANSENLMPAPGSTALFGLIVTGLDQTRPGYNFFRDPLAKEGIRKSDADKGMSFFKRLFSKVDQSLLMKLVGIETAHAEAAIDPVTAAIKKSVWFGSIVGLTVIAAFALKYKSPNIRKRLDEIHAYRRALDPATVDAEKMKGFREFMRIEGSILASIAQFPLISPGIATQYLVDRFAPNLGAGDHTLLRKTLNQTIYPNLRHFGKVSVNEKVTILGTGYAATGAVGLNYIHYFFVLPMFVSAVTPSLPEGMATVLNDTFGPQNRDTQAMLVTNLLVGASIGILRGPADFTMDAKSQVVEEIYSRVDNDLRRFGLNPDDPKLQSRREQMRESLINLTLIQKGLPSTAEILFDTMSLYSKVAGARGYASPDNDKLIKNLNPLSDSVEYERDVDGKIKIGSDGKMIVQEGSFILASRRGLLPSVLSRALAQAKAWHDLSPSPDTQKALRLVETMIEESERLRKILPKVAQAVLRASEKVALTIADPTNTSKHAALEDELARLRAGMNEVNARALAMRQLIVMANYEGPVEYTARYLPVAWKSEFGATATNMAVLYLRQAVASQLDGSTVDNLVARREDLLRFKDPAKAEAIAALKQQRPELADRSNAEIMSDANLEAEVLQRANLLAKHQGDDSRAQDAADRFKPDVGWIEQWRHRRAVHKAEARLAQYALRHAEQPELLSKDVLEARLREFYIEEAGRQIGLRIHGLNAADQKSARPQTGAPWQSSNEQYDQMIQQIQGRSVLIAKQQIESRNMRTYLAKLNTVDATRVKLQLHASIFLAGYRDATTMANQVSPLDSAQPGFTQGVRQALTRQTAKDLQVLADLEASRSNDFDRKLTGFRRRVVSTTASAANRGLRVIDSMFHDQAIDRGALGVIQRRVPFAEEMVSANIRNLKFWPVAFTVSWVWSHFALGTGISYSFWVTAVLTQGVFAMLPVQWLFRNYRMQDFKPYDSDRPGWKGVSHLARKYMTSEALAYAVTAFAIIPAVLLTTDIGRDLTRYVGEPFAKAMQGYSMVEISTTIAAGLLSYIAGSKFYEKWKMKQTMSRLSALKDKAAAMKEKTAALKAEIDAARRARAEEAARRSSAQGFSSGGGRTCRGLFGSGRAS